MLEWTSALGWVRANKLIPALEIGTAMASLFSGVTTTHSSSWGVDWVPICKALSADLSAEIMPIIGPKCRQSARMPRKIPT